MANFQTCNRRRWPHLAAVVLLVAMVVMIALLHGLLWSVSDLSRDQTLAVEQRATLARVARTLEPWNERFEVNAAIADARRSLSDGTSAGVDRAYFLLLPYATTVRGDALFKQTYQAVLAEKWKLDARKAHQQHAKEQEGGVLDEKDVFK